MGSEVEQQQKQEEGVIKHVFLGKWKDDVPEEKKEELIKKYATLVGKTPMKSFKWGKEMGIKGKNFGYTHIFMSTFDSPEAVKEYLLHPDHCTFADEFLPHLKERIVVDFIPGRLLLDD